MGGAAPLMGFTLVWIVLALAGGTAAALVFNRDGNGGTLAVLRGLILFIMGFVTTSFIVMWLPVMFMQFNN